jgi:PAS domain S-box-containing protein
MDKAAILVVENDGILAACLKTMISQLGYTVLGPVASGEQALTFLGGQCVDLVIMDIDPDGTKNGITTAEQISAVAGIPIVFLSAFSRDPLLEQAKAATPYGYLIKPVSERELAATVEIALHRHALDRQLRESQAALEKSEAKYRHLFENLPLGIFRTSLDGKILDGNLEMARMVGCTSPEEVLQTFTDMPGQLYVDPVRRQELIALLQKNGVVKNFEFLARKKNEENIWISMNAWINPADSSGETVIEGFAQDITDRKRAEQAVQESEERYRQVSSITSDIAYSCSASTAGDYALDWMVGAVERITGYSLEEILEHGGWSYLVIDSDLRMFERNVIGLAPGMSSQCDLRLCHKDGSIRWVECTTKCLVLPQDTGIVRLYGGLVDITERKQLGEVLRLVAESGLTPGQDIFRFLVRQLAVTLHKRYVMIACINGGDSGTAHTIAVWQDGAFAENFSYPLAGTPCEKVAAQGVSFYPCNVQKFFPNDSLLTLMGAESYWGVPLRDTAGNILGLLALFDDCPMEESSQIFAMLTSFAVRAAAELERMNSEKKYQSLFNKMQEGFAVHEIICDESGKPVDYRFLDVNPAFEHLTGLRSTRIVGKRVLEVLPQLEKWWIEKYGRVALTGQPIYFEDYNEKLDKHFEIRAFQSEVNRFACIVTDISDHKRSEVERAKLREQLYHAQKMEDIGRFTGGVAHDFNNHLTAIIGCSQLILNKTAEATELRHLAEMVCSAGEKAATLTRSLLTFSRKQPVEMKPVDIQQIIADIQRLLRRLIGEDIDLEFDKGDTPLFVNADSGHMEQVIMNMAANARDAMPDGGTILIKTELRSLDHEFMSIYGWGEKGDYAVISVSDTGTGIPEEDRGKIFEPFYTSKEEGKGTGLGLSIVHGIIQQHGGHIQLDSTPGLGTTFKIFLPLIAPRSKQPEHARQLQHQRGNETILVCEDDEAVRRLVRLVLTDCGYEVLEAVDGQDAVECYLRYQDRVSLVILDVVMPKKNGVAVYGEICAFRPDVRVLFTSGYTPEAIARSGVFDMKAHFLPKPIAPGLMLTKVREMLDER